MHLQSDATVRPVVRLLGVSKRFPGMVALDDVSFDVMPVTCHALMGENGAGKSTLGKILAGIHRPDGGGFEFEGVARSFHRPWDALQAGIGFVPQELSYCPNLTVAENVCLSSLPRRRFQLDRAAMKTKAEQFLQEVGADCRLDDELGILTAGQIQLVQIASALATGARLLVMDEPTSSLSQAEAQRLEEILLRLRQKGTTILYVSHRMEEVFRICDTVTVLRDGRHISTMPIANTTEQDLVRMMIGRELAKYFPTHTQRSPGPEMLRLESFSSPGKFRDVNLTLHGGDVLGIAGLVGSGRSEIALGIFGLDSHATGRVFVDRKPAEFRNPRQAIMAGIGLVAEERKRQGIVPDMSCGENSTLATLDCPGGRRFWGRLFRCPWCSNRCDCLRLWNVLRARQERRFVADYFKSLDVRAASPEVPIATLSGGNQQKLMLARWLMRRSRIILLDEPTRGVDVGAKAEIHRLIDELAAEGRAILMISSELPELLHLSTRVLVMREGRAVGILERSEATQEKIMQLMAGCSEGGASR